MLTACGGLHDDETGNVTIILPEAKAAGRSIAKEKIDGLEQATALYRVHMNDRTLEGTGGKFSAYFAVGLNVDIYIECLNSNRDVIVRTGIKTVVVKNRGNVVDFNLMADGNEIAQPTSQPATPPIPPAPQPVPGKVTYNGNGADSGTPSDTQSYDAGSEVTLQTGEPSRTGYTFAGWTSDKDLKYTNPTNSQEETIAQGTAFVSDSSSVQGVTDKIANFKMPDGGVVLTATWIPIQYTVQYDANSVVLTGSLPTNPTGTYTITDNVSIQIPPQPWNLANGKMWTGWALTSNSMQTLTSQALANGSVSMQTLAPHADASNVIKLYAMWETAYTLTLNLNGGSWATASDNKTQYSASQLSLPTPTAPDSKFTFVGWADNTNLNGTVTAIPANTTGAKTYYAVYHTISAGAVASTTSSATGSIEFVAVQGGTVPLATDYMPVVSNFSIGKYEITQAQWRDVMTDMPTGMAKTDGDPDRNPVNYVSWYDAIAFCNKLSIKENKQPCYSVNGIDDWEALQYSAIPRSTNTDWDNATCDFTKNGYRLPTEAEWEYAARGGINHSPYTYSGSDTVGNVAWHSGNADSKTHEVGTRTANALGISDMSGNVFEWCWDWNASEYDKGSVTDPHSVAPESKRVKRGSSYDTTDSTKCSVSFRYGGSPYSTAGGGIRIVCRP